MFSKILLVFFDFGHLQEETGYQNSTKSANRPLSLCQSQIFQKNFKKCFCFLEYYLWWEFRQYWTIFGGVRAQKPPKKGHFVDAESVLKTLKVFDLTNTNSILMKLTTIMYLHERVNRKALWARNSVLWLNFQEFSRTAIKTIPYVMHYLTSHH